MTRLLLISVIAISLVGCATGTELLTDQVYPAIEDPTAVNILVEMPEGAEHIAVVNASSGVGTKRNSLEKVIEVLKSRAAKVGANAVVLTDQDRTRWYPLGKGFTHKERIEGIAIFVR
jgi:hypothetical protein